MYKVIIVDDSALFRREIVLTMPWEDLNCMVVGLAEDGLPGYNMIMDIRPDIVITDVRMIQMDGIEMIKKLKRYGCKARFIVVSAYSEFDYAVEALKMQADDYILKPIADGTLESAIEKSIAKISAQKVDAIPTFNNPIIEDFYENYHQIEAKIKRNDANTYIVNASLYIREHYATNDISIATVAKQLEISESYLVRLFRQELGITFNDYLTRHRMYLSLRLLSDFSSTIYHVAEEVGYSDYRYFAKVFKRTFQMNPSEFKNKYN